MKRFAPAKINLSLRVLGRREDGFHEIETLISPITLADEITIEPGAGLQLTCDDPSLPTDGRNLLTARPRSSAIARASGQISPRDSQTHPARRRPRRRQQRRRDGPAGAHETLATPLPLDALTVIAAQLGSDVPVFLHRQAAVCRGRGEKVTPSPFAERLPLLLLKPPFPVPTPWAYQHWRDSTEIPGVRYSPQSFAWGELVNDLERPVFSKYLPLATLKSWLLEQSDVAGALMSGSGSTVFAVLKDPAGADALAERAREFFGELWTCACETGNPEA